MLQLLLAKYSGLKSKFYQVDSFKVKRAM